MSAPLSAVLNDRNVSPPRSAKFEAEPASVTSSAFGPEPVSATDSGLQVPEHTSVAESGSRSSLNASSTFTAISSRSNDQSHKAGRNQYATSQGVVRAPQLIDSSDSPLAKRRRRNGPSDNQSSLPPQSPKRQRLERDPSEDDHLHRLIFGIPTRLPRQTSVPVPQQPSRDFLPPPVSIDRQQIEHDPINQRHSMHSLVKPSRSYPSPLWAPPSPPAHWPPNQNSAKRQFRLPSHLSRSALLPPFPGIFNSLLKHPELILNLSTYLTLDNLLVLYAISRPYHRLTNQCFTATLLGHAEHHYPESVLAFPFHCYQRLCRLDPFERPNEMREGQVRWVPSFKYLQMLSFRERVVDEIIALLQVEGLNFPAMTSITIKKIWFIMDIPDNMRRTGLIRNQYEWNNDDLYRATEFFMKLDMRFTNPLTGTGSQDLRKLVLAQRSLSTLWRVLKREELRSQLDVLRMAVRTHYVPAAMHAHLSILGVPANEVGRLQWEGYGKRVGKKLLQVHELVVREGVRRRLELQCHYLDMAIAGFVDKGAMNVDEWTDVMRQGEMEVIDCEVDSNGEEVREEELSEWESEDEYFREEGDSDADEGGDGDDEEEEEKKDGNGTGGNLLFEEDDDDDDLNEAQAACKPHKRRTRREAGL